MEGLKKALGLLLQHKWKFLLTIVSTLVFGFLLFPFGDLADLISSQVSKLTNNQVYLQFENMNMSLFPDTGVALKDVHVEGQAFPSLKAQEVIFTPSVMSLISQKPAGTVHAKGFLRGEIEVSMKPGPKSDNGTERQRITLNAKQLSLADLKNLANLPISIKGSTNITSQALVDLSFSEQPDMDVTLKIDRFELPTSNVQTMMGPLTLPELKLTSVELRGRLSAGKLLIEEGNIGKENDELRGTIKGNINLVIQNRGGAISPQMGAYNFDIDLNVRKSLQDRAGLFLTFIDAYKTPNPEGAQYRFKVSATDLQNPPNISAMR